MINFIVDSHIMLKSTIKRNNTDAFVYFKVVLLKEKENI